MKKEKKKQKRQRKKKVKLLMTIGPRLEKDPTQSAKAVTEPLPKKKPETKAVPTAEAPTIPSSTTKQPETTQLPTSTPQLSEEDKAAFLAMGQALGLPQIVKAINRNAEAIKAIAGSGKRGQKPSGKKDGGLPGWLDDLVPPEVRKEIAGAIINFVTGGGDKEGNTETVSVDQRLINEGVKYAVLRQKKALEATTLLVDNLLSGGKVVKDEKGNVAIMRSAPPGVQNKE